MSLLLEQFKQHTRRGPSDIVAVDVATTGSKIVRIRRSKDKLTLVGADIGPVIPLKELNADQQTHFLRSIVPKSLTTNYAAITVTGESSVVRLLSLPGHNDPSQLTDAQIREHMGLEGEYRLSHMVTSPPKGKTETRLLAATMMETEAATILSLTPTGAPAAQSIEIAGLSALNAFAHGPGAHLDQDSFGLLEAGARVCFLAFFSKGTLALVRKFDFGGDALTAKVQQQLGVDYEIAQGIISDGSFDVSQSVHDVMDPFLRQLSISKDFVERREDCRLSKFYVSGGACLSRYWSDELSKATGLAVESWDPFEGMTLLPGAIPEKLEGQQPRFTAAVGAALGALDES